MTFWEFSIAWIIGSIVFIYLAITSAGDGHDED